MSDLSSDMCSSDLRGHSSDDLSSVCGVCPADRGVGGKRRNHRDGAKGHRKAFGCRHINRSSRPADLVGTGTDRRRLSQQRRHKLLGPTDTAARHSLRPHPRCDHAAFPGRSEEQTYELKSLMRISYAVLCSKYKNTKNKTTYTQKQ